MLLTHHHFDHVSEVGALRERWPKLEVLIHPVERELLAESLATGTVEPGQALHFGTLEVRPLLTPGHTAGMLSFAVGVPDGQVRPSSTTAPGGFTGREGAVFTGDTLFAARSAEYVRPGHTTYTDLKDSIMGTLMELPPDTVIQPGHADPTSVARGVGAQPVHPRVARPRRARARALHRAGRARDAGAAVRRLRRRTQGVGALAGRLGRHRARLAGPTPGVTAGRHKPRPDVCVRILPVLIWMDRGYV